MGNLAKGIKETLPEFQKFLLERSLAPEKNVPFLAYWVSRFLTFGRKRDISTADYNEAAVIEFLDTLRADEKSLDWQPRQADDALRLYYLHYLGKTGGQTGGTEGIVDTESALSETRCLIRLRHYKNVETTMIYTHVLRDMTNAPKSPLDALYSGK